MPGCLGGESNILVWLLLSTKKTGWVVALVQKQTTPLQALKTYLKIFQLVFVNDHHYIHHIER